MNRFKIGIILLFITLSASAQQISDKLVGVNLWLNPSQQVWGLTEDCGVQTIRIGGHAYDTNMPNKTTMLNWVKQIQAIGAEPIVQVSQYQSPQAAAEMVEFLNIEKSGEIAPIKYWNIGNEPWLQNGRPATSTVGKMVETYFKPIAAAMKEIDPSIKIIGPDFCYYIDPAINDLFGGKNDISGMVPGKDYYYCDGLSWHRYPQDGNINLAYGGIDDFKGSIEKSRIKVDEVNAKHNRTGDDALVWGIGEYNAKGGAEVHTWENGQMFGGILGLCMKHEALYAASWSMFENGGSRTGTDFSFIDGANMAPRSSYYHMQMVASYFKGEYIDGKASNNDFYVYGAKNEEQTSVMIMHRSAGAPKEYTLHLNDTATSGQNVINIFAEQDLHYSDLIAPRSTQVIVFRGDSIIKINYSASDFENERPPVLSNVIFASELPLVPESFNVLPTSFQAIELSWINVSDNVMGIIIERENTNGFEVIAIIPSNDTIYTDNNLTHETEYTYRISVYNSMGKSEYSDTLSATTLEVPAPVAFNGPHSIPGKIEAEDFNDNESGIGYFDSGESNQGEEYRETGVDIEASTDEGGGYNVGYVTDGEWLAYLIENVSPGTYDMAFRVASNTDDNKRIDAYIDGKRVALVRPESTGGWQNWVTLYAQNIKIESSDPVLLTLKFVGEGFNLNWFELGEDLVTSNKNHLSNSDIKAYYLPAKEMIRISSEITVEQATVQVFNLYGKSVYKGNFTNFMQNEIPVSAWIQGFYIVSVQHSKGHYTNKLIIK